MQHVDRFVAGLAAAAAWLVLPVSLLLFLQWPLRDLLHRWSLAANDLAQWQFALYVAVAVAAATRQRAHLGIEGMARHMPPAARDAMTRVGTALCLLPWAVFIVLVGAGPVWRSVVTFEAYPETGNPGYFLVRLSALLLAVLLVLQTLLDLWRRREH